MSIPHLKGGNIVWNFVKDHIIEEKEQYEAIGLRGFDYLRKRSVGGLERYYTLLVICSPDQSDKLHAPMNYWVITS